MTFFVVDLEATCWETKEEQGHKPNEIIEIGIVELADNLDYVKSKSYVVKPRYTKVTPFCSTLTGWTQEQVDKGLDIEATLKLLDQEFDLKRAESWGSWGAYDYNKLWAGRDDKKRGSLTEIYDITWSPFTPLYHLNLKQEFAEIYKTKPMGMQKALNFLHIPLEGRHHNGEDDAKNIAKIVQKMY